MHITLNITPLSSIKDWFFGTRFGRFCWNLHAYIRQDSIITKELKDYTFTQITQNAVNEVFKRCHFEGTWFAESKKHAISQAMHRLPKPAAPQLPPSEKFIDNPSPTSSSTNPPSPSFSRSDSRPSTTDVSPESSAISPVSSERCNSPSPRLYEEKSCASSPYSFGGDYFEISSFLSSSSAVASSSSINPPQSFVPEYSSEGGKITYTDPRVAREFIRTDFTGNFMNGLQVEFADSIEVGRIFTECLIPPNLQSYSVIPEEIKEGKKTIKAEQHFEIKLAKPKVTKIEVNGKSISANVNEKIAGKIDINNNIISFTPGAITGEVQVPLVGKIQATLRSIGCYDQGFLVTVTPLGRLRWLKKEITQYWSIADYKKYFGQLKWEN